MVRAEIEALKHYQSPVGQTADQAEQQDLQQFVIYRCVVGSRAYASEVAYSQIMEREPRMVAEGDPVMLAGPTETQAQRRVRVTQHLFRDMVLSGYACKCSVCTLPIRQLLVASHIVGWAADAANRMNPRNGICLCALHDRAFDAGILDVDEQYVIRITDHVRLDRNNPAVKTMLHRFNGERIKLPDRWLPDPELLTKRRQLLGIGA